MGTLSALTVSGNSQLGSVDIYDNGALGVVAADTGHDLELRGRSSQAVNIVSGGTTTAVFDASGITTFAGSVLIPFGSASAPSLAFSGDTNTGIYRTSSDQLGFAASGVNQATFLTNRYMFGTTVSGVYYDASSAYVPTMLVKSSHSGELATLALINGDNAYGSAIDFAHITSNTSVQQRFASIVGVSDSLVSTAGSGHLSFRTRASGSTTNVVERMQVTAAGKVDINKATSFSAYPTGSQLNVYGDGEAIRMDGSGNTSRTLRFRNVSTTNPGQIIADGTLEISTEDANTSIGLLSVRDITYKTTTTNAAAGNHKFYVYNISAFFLLSF